MAPMANVTDWAFRRIVAKCGRPDVFYTEFLSCDGIVHDKKRFEKELYFEKSESPIVVQFFGARPENFYKCAQLAKELGFDGIDINMGCPDRSVEKQGAGAALINNPKLAQEIIKETKRGSGNLPISVKTRLGYNKIATKEWIPVLLEAEPAALIIHGRTRKEMSAVPAHWDEIGLAKEIATGSINSRQEDTKTLIIGNGDVSDITDAKQKANDYKLDGIMVGRGIFANPWFFSADIGPATHGSLSEKGGSASGGNDPMKTPEQRIELMLEHINLFTKLWGPDKKFDVMKKFFKVYISNWPACAGRPGAKELRARIMTVKNKEEVVDILAKMV